VRSCFQKIDQNGSSAGFQNNASYSLVYAWAEETNLDVQAAHAICTNCKILLVESFDATNASFATAENTAASFGANEISNSYGMAESKLSVWYPSAYNHAGIAITVSAGDGSYIAGTQYPADLNTVVAVGGTALYLNSDSTYNSESVWHDGYVGTDSTDWGTGSGCSGFVSSYTSAAWWQSSAVNWSSAGCGGRRGVADVSADAASGTGAWVYISLAAPTTQTTGWYRIGGTSLAAPLIAAVYALAGNASAYTWPAQFTYQHANQLHDVRSGSNGTCSTTICKANVGYDGPTGIGTPWGTGGF
jgi:subtilase family serine protease